MSYALLVFLIGAEVRVEAFNRMHDCELRKAEIYEETGGRARCLWIREGERV
jgi:hypothetical protein